jgi:anti-anti-sigma factor
VRVESIQERTEEGFLVIEPLAPLDSKLAPALLKVANLHIRKGVVCLALDLGKAAFLTSLGLSVLIQIHKSVTQKQGALVLFQLTQEAYEALVASRLEGLFKVASNAAGAVALLEEVCSSES